MGVVRKTKSVNNLLELFEQTKEALSAIDLVKRLESEMNKTTVYRILDRLVDGIRSTKYILCRIG
jgi:Fur family ferric uptake transcriptional regulator